MTDLSTTAVVASEWLRGWGISGISKQGDGDLRRLLVFSATAAVRMGRTDPNRQPRLAKLLNERLPAFRQSA